MFVRILGAAIRGLFVALLIAMPSLLLPEHFNQSPEITVFIALLGASLTFAEYFSNYPSIVEFREAPPFNRTRFIVLVIMIACVALVVRHPIAPTGLTALVAHIAGTLGSLLDFAYSPVQLLTLAVPFDTSHSLQGLVRDTAALAYMLGIVGILFFGAIIQLANWPLGRGSFNVWVNLPLFDPTAGGDVVDRLRRDGWGNLMIGLFLPFFLPAVLDLAGPLFDAKQVMQPQTLIWMVCGWSFIPMSMVLRGMAMLRVAALIAQIRRRTCADTDEAMLPA